MDSVESRTGEGIVETAAAWLHNVHGSLAVEVEAVAALVAKVVLLKAFERH